MSSATNIMPKALSTVSFARMAKDLAGVCCFALVVTALSIRGYHRVGQTSLDPHAESSAMCDFRDVVYYPIKAVLAGVNPYDNRMDGEPSRYRSQFPVYNVFPLYSPILFPIALPFGLLPFAASQAFFWATNVGLTLLLAWVAWRWSGTKPSIAATTTLASLILLSRPGNANLYYGQVTLLALIPSIAALWFARTRPWFSGVALAVATLKPTFGGPILLLMLARRDWKAATIGLTLAASVALIGMGIIFARDAAPEGIFDVLLANQRSTEAGSGVEASTSGSRVDLPLVAERLFGPSPAMLWKMVLPLCVLGIGCLTVFRLSQVETSGPSSKDTTNVRNRLSDSVALVTTAICIYHNIYDALLVVLPLVWITTRTLTGTDRGALCLPVVIAIAFTIPAINFLSSRQFGNLLQGWFSQTSFRFPTASGTGWTAMSIANGLALFFGWSLLLASSWRLDKRDWSFNLRA